MSAIVVVNHERDWPVEAPSLSVVSARRYLGDAAYIENHHRARVFNLCRTERYQGRGYYVSLLAEGRGHRPMPDVKTLGDLQTESGRRLMIGGVEEHAQRALANHPEDRVVLDAYCGRDPTCRFEALSQQLFAALRAPLIRATFTRRNGAWTLAGVHLLSANDIEPHQRESVSDALTEFVARTRTRTRDARPPGASLAILFNADEPHPPSNQQALTKFCAAAQELGIRTQFLGRSDIDRVPEFDALFIRDTTGVNNYTYQFARRAAAEGLVVIDDPESILKCTNKVYLNELLTRHRVPTPKTLMVHRDNVDQIIPSLGLPFVLKQPDGAFSLGVRKIRSRDELRDGIDKLFDESDLLIAQAWLPTAFDWRVGVCDRRPLYVCKYFMAPGHWQVIKREAGQQFEGSTKALTIGEAPEMVVKTAVRAANLIGDGFYGVDLKQADDHCYVMEVNDNPNVDAGNEDGVLEAALYRELMGVFLRRIHERKRTPAP